MVVDISHLGGVHQHLHQLQASFVASENRTDIALDDPNFWQKWAKKADLDLDLLNSKVGRRRQWGGE